MRLISYGRLRLLIVLVLVCSKSARVQAAQLESDDPAKSAVTLTPNVEFEEHKNYILSVAFWPDEKTLTSVSWNGIVRMWDLQTNREKRSWNALLVQKNSPAIAAYSNDGKTLATAGRSNRVVLWNPQTGKERSVLRRHRGRVTALAFSPDSKTLVTAGTDRSIRYWNASTGDFVPPLYKPRADVSFMRFSPDGDTLLWGKSGLLKFWITGSTKEAHKLKVSINSIRIARFSQDGKKLLTARKSMSIQLWDLTTGMPTNAFGLPSNQGRSYRINSVALAPNGGLVAVAGRQSGKALSRGVHGLAWLVDLSKPGIKFNLPVKDAVHAIAFSADGRSVVTGGGHPTITRSTDK